MKKSISAQFKGSAHLAKLELSSITKLTGESFLAFSMRVKNTVSIAYPDLGSEARKAIAFDKFKDGLTPELRIQILKDANIECIEGALERGVLLQTVGKGVEGSLLNISHEKSLEQLSKEIADISIKMESFINGHREECSNYIQRPSYNKNVECYKCHRLGHIAKYCPSTHLTVCSVNKFRSEDLIREEVKLNGVSTTGIVDTGSTINIISLTHFKDKFDSLSLSQNNCVKIRDA
ncbi:hypothetical protein RF11_08178 [Thelohanellus kitauei]|uniref:CCHC-type domain-containing protein n=1 Tax=Thelohanellus kitauei TaxID=669202 RepID=A0A0C2J7M2_THEKT|nr:hypothetical protein RF11_08178 [Thelohanellus kitauei]